MFIKTGKTPRDYRIYMVMLIEFILCGPALDTQKSLSLESSLEKL